VPLAATPVRVGESRDLTVVKARAFEGLVANWMTIGIIGVVVARLCRSAGLLLQKCAATPKRANWAGLPCARPCPPAGPTGLSGQFGLSLAFPFLKAVSNLVLNYF
jgi:hypothetical protein